MSKSAAAAAPFASAYYRRIPLGHALEASQPKATVLCGGLFQGTEATSGPWHPSLQHGGPPCALLARAFELEATKVGLPFVSRVTVQFFRPVKVGALLSVEVEPVRVGTKAAHFQASLFEHAVGNVGHRTELLRASSLGTRLASVEGVPPPPPELTHEYPTPPVDPPRPYFLQSDAERLALAFEANFKYMEYIDVRVASGQHGKGPTFTWAAAPLPLLEGDAGAPSPLERTLIWADSTGGMSHYVKMHATSFVNADLTLNLIRPLDGDWVGLRARTDLAPGYGQGLASGMLFDRGGFYGRVSQQQIVESRL